MIRRLPVPSICAASIRSRFDEARAAVGVDEAGREGAREDDHDRAADAGSEPQGRERHPGDRRYKAQHVEDRRDDVVEPAEPAHHEAERHADRGREEEAIGEALKLDATCCGKVAPANGVVSSSTKRAGLPTARAGTDAGQPRTRDRMAHTPKNSAGRAAP